MIIETAKPRRRTWLRLIWPLLLTVLAVTAVVVTQSGADAEAELDYLETMRDQARDLSLGGDALRVVVARLARVERSEVVTVTSDVRADLQAGLDLVEAGPPSERLIAANSLYRQALQSWTVGLSGFTSGVLAAADNPNSTVVVDNMANALAELRAGDRLYLDLLRELATEEAPEPVGPLPEVRLLPVDGELFSLSQAYVQAARSVNSRIALRPSLGLSQITSDPAWAVNPSDQVVVPATEAITFSVVVTNHGNVESVPEQVVLTLKGEDGSVVVEENVPVLGPGEQTALVFPDLPVVPGAVYEVTAELLVRDLDTNLDDNLLAVLFMVNEPEGE